MYATLSHLGDLWSAYRACRDDVASVTVFGSARCRPNDELYEAARKVGFLLARDGYRVVTGGGPGVMEGASRGAKEAGGATLGLNVRLFPEQDPNPYLDRVLTFQHFDLRKAALIHRSRAIVVMAGGFGTLDELFDVVVLRQKQKIDPVPLILVGGEFWSPLMEFIEASVVATGAAGRSESALLQLADTPAQAVALVRGLPGSVPAGERLRRRLTELSCRLACLPASTAAGIVAGSIARQAFSPA
jgi:uncharacterized protein (TIGR00730 family)